MLTKTCLTCSKEKPVTEFHKLKSGRHGVMAHCKSCRKVSQAEKYKERWFHLTCNLKRSFCKKRGISFDLDAEYLESIWTERCPVFGVEFVKHDKTHDYSPALDRIDPSRGYTKGNVVYISARANRIKYDASPEELRKVLDFVEGATTIPEGSTPKRVEAPDTER